MSDDRPSCYVSIECIFGLRNCPSSQTPETTLKVDIVSVLSKKTRPFPWRPEEKKCMFCGCKIRRSSWGRSCRSTREQIFTIYFRPDFLPLHERYRDDNSIKHYLPWRSSLSALLGIRWLFSVSVAGTGTWPRHQRLHVGLPTSTLRFKGRPPKVDSFCRKEYDCGTCADLCTPNKNVGRRRTRRVERLCPELTRQAYRHFGCTLVLVCFRLHLLHLLQTTSCRLRADIVPCKRSSLLEPPPQELVATRPELSISYIITRSL